MELVGRVVAKKFKGSRVLTGVIESYDPSSGFFKIAYEDGNSEELDLSEATSLVQSVPEKVVKKRGRKPMKRHRIRDDPGKGSGNLVDNNHVRSSEDSAAEFGLGQNLYDGVSVNGDLHKDVKVNGGLDLNLNEGLSLDVRSHANFNSQQDSCFRASIDLNLSAVNDIDEGFGSEVEKKERGFDLNQVFDDEIVELDTKHEEQLMDVPVGMVESKNSSSLGVVKKIDVESVCLNGTLDENVSVQFVKGDPGSGSVGGDQDEKESGRGNISDVIDAAKVNSDTSKFYLKEGYQEAATPVSCEDETHGRRKRRKLTSRLHYPEEGCLRRSARRAKALASAKNNETSVDVIYVANGISSSGMSVVSEEKPNLPDGEGVEESKVLPPWVELPPSSKNLNLEGIPVLDLFSVYACLRSFSALLYLSPFKLEDFVVALKSKVANTLLDSVHVAIFQTLRKHLEFLSNDGSEPASICLRNLNWDLLDVVTWPIFLAEYLLIHGSGMKPCFSIGSLKLVDSDYYKQPAGVKIVILQCLCDDIIEVECIRTELNRRTLASEFVADFDRKFYNGNFRKTRASLDSAENALLAEDDDANTTDWNSDECCLCKMEGNLICCDGCPAAYHSRCVGVASTLLPEGEWYCPECANNRHNSDIKLQNLIRGAELLGADPYGRIYFHCCGYLLVSESCDAESSFNCYHKDDLNTVIHVLESSGFPYGSITRAVSKCLAVHADLDQRESCLPAVCKPTKHSMPADNGAVKAELGNERKFEGLGNPTTSSEGSAEVLQGSEPSQTCNKTSGDRTSLVSENSDLSGVHLAAENTGFGAKRRKRGRPLGVRRKSSVTQAKGAKEPPVQVDTLYVNHYSFARVASLIAEEIGHKPSDKISEALMMKSEEEIISTQLKTISKKSSKFCWPSVQNICVEMQKEKCGWCYSCKSSDEDRDCLFNVITTRSISEGFKAELDVLQSKQNKKGHLLDLTCYILSMECRLQGLLLGPWLHPDGSQFFLRNVLKALDFASVKHRLLLLESNLRPSALSADWGKPVDVAVTMGSASYVVISTRVSSKYGIWRKRNRFCGFVPAPVNASGGLVMLWWRGGQASRKLFNWKFLPRSLALKVARKGGCMKMSGLFYPDSSEHVKRSKQIAWRAAVEMSTSVAQLALQVRELDLNIRWDEIENTHILSTLDKESQKSIKLFKKVVVRRKCVEGTVVKYLLDFGKRRLLPDVVQRHGSKVDDLTSERKKYWLEESYLPLHLLRNFEEKRIARKAGKMTSSKVLYGGKVLNKPFKRKGLEYLFARAERSNYYQCGHCKKDVPIREAVSCQFCKGYFHKRHVRKSIGKKCTYTCHRCQSRKRVQIVKKKGEVKLQKIQYKNGMKSGKLTGKVKSKRGRKPKADRIPVALEKKRRVQVPERSSLPPEKANVYAGVTLRRSARIKFAPVQYNDVAEGSKPEEQSKCRNGSDKKSAKEHSYRKKRTMPLSTLWKNGLRLSRKPDDGRAAEFKRRKLLIPSESSVETADQPKCTLCGKEGYTAALKYIACEICGDWYHGDAFGLDAEVIKSLIGFRCHACLKRSPPVCPFVENAKQAANNAGMEVAQSLEVVLDPKETNVVHNCAPDVNDQDPVQVEEAVHNQTSTMEPELSMENGHLSTSEGPSTFGLQADTLPAKCNENLVLEGNKISPCLSDKSGASVKDLKDTELAGLDMSNPVAEVTCEPNQSVMTLEDMKDTDMSEVNLEDPKDTTSRCVQEVCEPCKSDMGVKDAEDSEMSDLGEPTTLPEVEGKSDKCDMNVTLARDTDMSETADLTPVLNIGGKPEKPDVDVKDVTDTNMSDMAESTSPADMGKSELDGEVIKEC